MFPRPASNGMRVLMISVDRSRQGILHPGTPAFKRQEAYARKFGNLDIVGFSLKRDDATVLAAEKLRVYPTNSLSRLLYGFDALRIALTLPKPDVVTVQDPFEAGLMGLFVARVRGVPLHVQVHTDFLSPQYAQSSFVHRIRVLLAGFVLRRAARVRVVSQRVRLSMENRYMLRGPITVLPIFVDTEHFRWNLPDEVLRMRFNTFSSRVLVVSRLEKEKDVETAIRVFAEYAPITACLIVVGDGSERGYLESLVASLDIQHRTFFEGQQDPTSYYKLSDLVLFTSRYDGYGLVIAEALSAGTPVLSTDVGAARELGAIVAASSEEIGQAMVEWFQHGRKEGHLHAYPYENFEAYVRAYSDDIVACARK